MRFRIQVLDKWFDDKVQNHTNGYVEIVRYADDFICLVQTQDEAQKILSIMRQSAILNMPDDEFESIPQLIKEIKNKIEKLKSIGDIELEKKILNWEVKENLTFISINKILSKPTDIAFLEFPDDKLFLNNIIGDLSKILQELMS